MRAGCFNKARRHRRGDAGVVRNRNITAPTSGRRARGAVSDQVGSRMMSANPKWIVMLAKRGQQFAQRQCAGRRRSCDRRSPAAPAMSAARAVMPEKVTIARPVPRPGGRVAAPNRRESARPDPAPLIAPYWRNNGAVHARRAGDRGRVAISLHSARPVDLEDDDGWSASRQGYSGAAQAVAVLTPSSISIGDHAICGIHGHVGDEVGRPRSHSRCAGAPQPDAPLPKDRACSTVRPIRRRSVRQTDGAGVPRSS